MLLLHVGTIVISGEANAYTLGTFVRDRLPSGGSHVFQKSDLPELMGEPESAELHELYEIDLMAESGHEDEVGRFLFETKWDQFAGLMWWEDQLDLDEVEVPVAE